MLVLYGLRTAALTVPHEDFHHRNIVFIAVTSLLSRHDKGADRKGTCHSQPVRPSA